MIPRHAQSIPARELQVGDHVVGIGEIAEIEWPTGGAVVAISWTTTGVLHAFGIESTQTIVREPQS